MVNIPQHILLRELGGCISFNPFSQNEKQQEDKPKEETLKSSSHFSHGEERIKSRNKYDSIERICFRYPSHPRISSNVVRHSYRILKHLISSDNCTFLPVDKKKHPIVSEGVALGLTYADGKVFIQNKIDKTYDVFAVRERNHKLYSLPINPKWEDFAIVAHSTPNKISKPVIIILRKGNSIHVHDLETGYSITNIHLGRATRIISAFGSDTKSHNSILADQATSDLINVTFKMRFLSM